MISFARLGKAEGLGNQMFQYAFLRTAAKRLHVPFFCPPWLGDKIFQLGDDGERAKEPAGLVRNYCQPSTTSGFSADALQIKDGTEIFGFFQSPEYFDEREVRQWFSFQEHAVRRVREKYHGLDFSRWIGIHLRFGDMTHNPMFVILRPEYYHRALARLGRGKKVAVFSDEPKTAMAHLRGLKVDLTFIEGNANYEDLYIMSRCGDFVCSVSTLSWWGAWLNPSPGTVVAPREWIRPGHHSRSVDLNCERWVSVRGCRWIVDDYRFLIKRKLWEERLNRMRSRDSRENLRAFKGYLDRKMKAFRSKFRF